MAHPYKPSHRGIAFAATLVVLIVAAVAAWAFSRHEPEMAALRLAADRQHLSASVALPARPGNEGVVIEPSERPPEPVNHAEADGIESEASDAGASGEVPAQPTVEGDDPGAAGEQSPEPDTPGASRAQDLPRLVNAEAFAAPADQPRIALIIRDVGRLSLETQAAIETPAQVTLAFSPYGRDLATWIGRARVDGHETLMMLPMEPVDYPRNDPGPLALLTNLGAGDNAERLNRVLADADGSVGIMGEAGSRFLTEPAALEPVLATLAEAGFLYVDTNAENDAVAEVAEGLDLPVIDVDVEVTDTTLRAMIDRRLLELETIARDRGHAVGLADPYPIFLEQFATWSERLETRGFVLAPVTAVVGGADEP